MGVSDSLGVGIGLGVGDGKTYGVAAGGLGSVGSGGGVEVGCAVPALVADHAAATVKTQHATTTQPGPFLLPSAERFIEHRFADWPP